LNLNYTLQFTFTISNPSCSLSSIVGSNISAEECCTLGAILLTKDISN